VGDFNGDGQPDLAVTSEADNNVSVLFGNGNGAFAAAANYGVGNAPNLVAVVDFNWTASPTWPSLTQAATT
jgi:hypothetical protein